MNLKKQLVIKQKGADESSTVLKTSVFDLPAQFWQSGIDSFHFRDFPHAKITFSDFSNNRDNFEFIKEFNRLNSY